MTSMTIRNVPDDVVTIFKLRAEIAGQSLQEYMRDKLIKDARKLTPEEALGALEGSPIGSISVEQVIRAVHADHCADNKETPA